MISTLDIVGDAGNMDRSPMLHVAHPRYISDKKPSINKKHQYQQGTGVFYITACGNIEGDQRSYFAAV